MIGARGIGRRDACRNLESVARAALVVIGRHGLDAPLEEVAREAGVGIATLYRSCPNRAVLMHCVVAERLSGLEKAVEEAEKEMGTDPGGAFDRLFARLLEDSEISMLGYLLAHRDEPERVMPEHREAFADVIARYDAVVTAAQEAGAVRGDLHLMDMIFMAYAWQVSDGMTAEQARASSARRTAMCLSAAHGRPLPLSDRPVSFEELGFAEIPPH